MIKHLIIKDNKKANNKAVYLGLLNSYISKYLNKDISRELYIYSIRLINDMLYIDNTINNGDKEYINKYIINIVKIKAV